MFDETMNKDCMSEAGLIDLSIEEGPLGAISVVYWKCRIREGEGVVL